MKKELKNTKKKNNKGFSLVELIVVIAIMAVLMAVLAPAMLRYVEKSRIQKDESSASEVLSAVNNALADEEISEPITDGDTVAVANSGTGVAYTGSTNASALVTEITKTVDPASFKFTSKKYKDKTYTITIAVNAADATYKATGAWN